LGDVIGVVSLNASEFPGTPGPLEGAIDPPRSSDFSLVHKKSFVTIVVGYDAIPMQRAGDSTNKVVR
jgi:hypothetical protein